jgi:hypothetical protein
MWVFIGGQVLHICNPSTQEAKLEKSRVWSQLGLQTKMLSQKMYFIPKSKFCLIITITIYQNYNNIPNSQWIFLWYYVLNSMPVLASQMLCNLSLVPNPFSFGYFSVLLHAQASLHCDPPIYASCVARMKGMYQHTQLLLVEIWSHELFAQAILELQSFQSLLLLK